jgi:hypothetical protein
MADVRHLTPSYRRLMKHGAAGEAVTVSVRPEIYQSNRLLLGWDVTIRVKFDDGSTADFERYVDVSVLTLPGHHAPNEQVTAGQILPIRFDAQNRSQVEIDTNALRSEAVARAERQLESDGHADAATVEEAERNVKPITSDPPP